MEPLPPIPTPLNQRWREFRIQVLPLVFFVCVVVALVVVWRNYLQPVSLIGEVEAIRANATSLRDGTLVSLLVGRFDRVTNGQVVARIQSVTPEGLAASLAGAAGDLKLLKVRIDLDRTRNQDAYSQLKLDMLSERVALNLAKIRLVQAEKEFERVRTLHEQKIIPSGQGVGVAPSGRDVFGYDVALRDRDAFRAEVEDRARLMGDLEAEMKRLEASGLSTIPERDTLIEETLAAKQRELEELLGPVNLVSPMDGVVTVVYRRPGEQVVRGEPIVTVSAIQSDRIIGYMRQPVVRVPVPQDVIEVRTRGLPPLKGEGQVLEVGPQIEPINALLFSIDGTSNRVEMGLHILISMPPNLRNELRPGQVVDLSLRTAKGKKS